MIEKSITHPALPEETRERGTCSDCGTTTKTLTAPHSGARDYTGPMYCMSCNPRYFAGAAGIGSLERLEA